MWNEYSKEVKDGTLFPNDNLNSDLTDALAQYYSGISVLYWILCGLSVVSCILWTKWLIKDSPKGRKFTVYAALYGIFL